MKNSLSTLEYPDFLELLSGYCQTEPGRRNVLRLQPANSSGRIKHHHPAIAALLEAARQDIELPSVELRAMEKIFKQLTIKGHILTVTDLLKCADLMQSTSELQGFYNRLGQQLEQDALSAEELTTFPDFSKHLQSVLEAPDTLKSDASPLLAQLRRQTRELEAQINQRLESFCRHEEIQEQLQDEYITIRNGRYVIPVKAELKRRVPGLIHDQSDSGKTVFIEPKFLVEDGNNLTAMRLEERAEVRRILNQLTEALRSMLPALKVNYKALADYDMLRGITLWAIDYDCYLPRFGQQISIIQGRHPLLERQLRKENRSNQLTPLDFSPPGKNYKTVAITGSNAGGKTVVLKTLGLLSMIAQSGLPVPADPSSRFVIYHKILADIGDEQSLQQNLSTFSGHLSRIRDFMETVNPNHRQPYLVLLDEIGSGTDPLEGGALACAILKQFSERPAFTVATTHLGAVKTFATSQNDMTNASMLFNSETFTPEFRLIMGRPGASHALNLARKMDFPFEVMETAEALLDTDHLHLESVLSTLEDDQRRLMETESQLSTDRDKVKGLKETLSEELEELRRERKRILHEAYQQASRVVEKAQKEMDGMIKAAGKEIHSEKIKDKKARIQEKKERMVQETANTEAKPRQPLKLAQLKEGMTVWVEKLKTRAKITAINDRRREITIDYNGLPFTVPLKQIGKIIDDTKTPQAPAPRPMRTTRPRVSSVPMELNMVGMRAHSAQIELTGYIDRALMAGLDEVRIIHGFGSGILRDMVHEYLIRMGLDYRLGDQEKGEGGGGSTIVYLK